MKIGMNLLLWTSHVSEEHFPLLAQLKETGFDGVEIPVGQGDARHYEGLRAELDRQGLGCTAVTSLPPEMDPISPDPAVRRKAVERMEWAVEMTAILRAPVLVGPFHSAYKVFADHGPTEEELVRSAEVMHAAGEAAGRADVRLGIEPLNRFECYLVNTVEAARDLVHRADHPAVGILYDTHHAHIEAKNVARTIETCAAEIYHVHVSENDRGTPGSGQVRFDETFRTLKKVGYDEWLVIEAFSPAADPEFAAAIHVWRDFAPTREEIYRDGHRFIREAWKAA